MADGPTIVPSSGPPGGNGQVQGPVIGPAQLATSVQGQLIVLEVRHANGVTAAAMTKEQAAEFAKRLLNQATGLQIVRDIPPPPPQH